MKSLILRLAGLGVGHAIYIYTYKLASLTVSHILKFVITSFIRAQSHQYVMNNICIIEGCIRSNDLPVSIMWHIKQHAHVCRLRSRNICLRELDREVLYI